MSKQKKAFIARQGDVLIIRDDSVKPGAPIARDAGRVVLAYGEVTGHAHAIHDEGACLFALAEDAEEIERIVDRVLQVTGDRVVSLRHEEHSTIELPPGKYRVRIQSDYRPERIANVAD